MSFRFSHGGVDDAYTGTPRESEETMSNINKNRDLVNGYPVIMSADIPDREGMRKNCRVIMVDRGADGGHYAEFQRYVVSTAERGTPGWFQGNYITDVGEARAKFMELVEREIGSNSFRRVVTTELPGDGER